MRLAGFQIDADHARPSFSQRGFDRSGVQRGHGSIRDQDAHRALCDQRATAPASKPQTDLHAVRRFSGGDRQFVPRPGLAHGSNHAFERRFAANARLSFGVAGRP